MNHQTPTITLPLVVFLLATPVTPKKREEGVPFAEITPAKPPPQKLSGIGFEDPEFRDAFRRKMFWRLMGCRLTRRLIVL